MNITKFKSFGFYEPKPKYTLSSWSGKEDDTIHLRFNDILEKACKYGGYEEIQKAFLTEEMDDAYKIYIVIRCDHKLTKKCKINLKSILPMILPDHCFRSRLMSMVETYMQYKEFKLGKFVRAIIRDGCVISMNRLVELGILITGKHLELFKGDVNSLLFFATANKIVVCDKTEEKFKKLNLYDYYKETILTEQKKIILTTGLLHDLQSIIASYL